MQLKKVVAGAVTTIAVSALTLGTAAGASYAEPGHGKGPKPAPAVVASAPAVESVSATPTATTRRFQQSNVVVLAVSPAAATATATISVRDPKRGGAAITWNVAPNARYSGYYKKLSDIKVGFTIHLAGPRTGDEAPTADHVIAPGRNKKVLVQNVTVTAVSGSTVTTRDKKGKTFRWDVRGAKVAGKASRLAALSPGDVVDVRGEAVEGAASGRASVVRVTKDVPAKKKPAPKKPAKKK